MKRESASRGDARGQRALRVLCAEDDDQIALMLRFALEREGYLVERVEDGMSALERIAVDARFFDVLLTDHHMPRLSGLGLVAKLRDTAFSGVIVVHCSCLSQAELTAYRALAVDRILNKPVDLAELLAVLRRIGAAAP